MSAHHDDHGHGHDKKSSFPLYPLLIIAGTVIAALVVLKIFGISLPPIEWPN